MAPSDIQLLSSLAGLVGSLLSTFFTFGYESYPLAEFCSLDEVAIIEKKNKYRRLGQAVGLFLIVASFILQIITVV